MKFYLKKGADISKYGFVRETDRYWFWFRKNKFGRGHVNLVYYEKDRRITVNSASSECIVLLCEMYKNGDLLYLEEEKLVNVSLTQEEYEIIMARRNK